MNVLILGGGGREHALAWKIKQSPKCKDLYLAPGNAGTRALGENLPLDPLDFAGIAACIRERNIDLLVVGPEAPLVGGLRDYLEKEPGLADLGIVGPGEKTARLEGSKAFAKKFMHKYGIPTAAYRDFVAGEVEVAQSFLKRLAPPFVLKADGLAAGKGVLILNDLTVAEKEVAEMLGGKFGDASKRLVIEDFLAGREYSVFVLTDGQDYQLLPVAKDYKRRDEGDKGLNTGGMGAVSPVPFADVELMNKTISRIVEPTLAGLRAEKLSYCGFLFFGLIEVKGEPFVIEYNVRLGDPETEVVLPRVKGDFLQALVAAAQGTLGEIELEEDARVASTVISVSEGYPEAYAKGKAIRGLEEVEEATVFHAGTRKEGEEILSSGGRVLAFTALDENLEGALEKSYAAIKKVCYDGIAYRTDIGADLKL